MIMDPEKPAPLIMPFSEPGVEAVYKTKIEINNQYYSGILAISFEKDNNYRVIFLNELGMKFFDFEIGSNGLIVRSCFESFERKKILKIFEEAFTALFLDQKSCEMGKAMADNGGLHTVYPIEMQGKGYYFVSNSSGKLDQIEKYKGGSKSLIIKLDYIENLPDNITFLFPGTGIEFTLTHIEQ